MKKYLAFTLFLASITASFASAAQSVPSELSNHASHGMSSAEMQNMQQKMTEAKTQEERQALMAAQQKRMQAEGHVMGNMGDHRSMPSHQPGMGAMMKHRMPM